MLRRCAIVAFVSACAILPAAGSRAEDVDADLVRWIVDACAQGFDQDTMVRIDQVAGKAVWERLKGGKYREALMLALAYSECLDKAGAASGLPVFDERIKGFREIICFVPLVVTEVEQKVDRDLAGRCLSRCPAPAEQAPKEEKARARWAEEVRRHVHLSAAVLRPVDLLAVADRYLAALKAAGFPGPELPKPATAPEAGPGKAKVQAGGGKEPGTGGKGQENREPGAGDREVKSGMGQEGARKEEGPDPVFALRVFAVAASVAMGNLDRIVAGEGGDEAACKSMFLVALGVVQSMHMPRESALPLLVRDMVSRAPPETLVGIATTASKRFEGRQCLVPSTIASISVAGLSAETVDRAVAAGRIDEIAALVAVAPAGFMVPGSLDSKARIVEQVLKNVRGPDRGRRLCSLGDIRIRAGDHGAAFKAYTEAAALLPRDDRDCAVNGRLLAGFGAKEIALDDLAPIAAEFLAAGPDAGDVFRAVISPEAQERRAVAVKVIAGAAPSAAKEVRDAVVEALIKVVDTSPGLASAAAAVEAVEAAGGPGTVEEKVIWGLVKSRHHVASKDNAAGRKAMADTFAIVKPEMEAARAGTEAFLRWLAANRHYAMLDDAVKGGRAAKVIGSRALAGVAASLGEVGEKKRARGLLDAARAMRPLAEKDWLAIADAYARMDEARLGNEALRRVGPEKSWGSATWMAKGRLEMASKRFREAAGAFNKAADMDRDDSMPVFFGGLARLLLGDAEGAEQSFRKCMEMEDATGPVLGGLGYALFDQSRHEDAEVAFRKAIVKDEKGADNYIGLAMTLLRMGKVDEAVRQYRKAAELEPAMGQGYDAASKKGYVYSEVEKKAWDDLMVEVGKKKREK